MASESRRSRSESTEKADRSAAQPCVIASNVPDSAQNTTRQEVEFPTFRQMFRLDSSGFQTSIREQGVDKTFVPYEYDLSPASRM